jgi:hypothetical protein
MDPVKMKFALALWLSLGLSVIGPVSAQSAIAPSDLSAIVDGVRGRCGLGLLARTTSSQTCQGFKDYGSRIQCVAEDLGDEVRLKDAPVLREVASCYRRLGDALVSGRGASTDQINALEDICRKLRHETLLQRLPLARDAQIFASNALMPDFSRKTLVVPPVDPMRGIRLHDLPECAVVFAQPGGPTATAATSGPSRTAKSENVASTSSVEPVKVVSLALTPGVEQTPPGSAKVGAALTADGQANAGIPGSATEARSDGGVSERAVDPIAIKAADPAAAKNKGQSPVSELNASGPISESAVISALPAVSGSTKKIPRRSIVRAERNTARNTAGYDVAAPDPRALKPARTAAALPPEQESKTSSRSSGLGGTNSGYSAATPPPLPLTGPPSRPQTAGPAR